MDQALDPYRKWLGIPVTDQPPHHYRLLGIELFESDLDVISNAADGRMAQVKSFQTGKYGAVSQRILNEIAGAKICLLDPRKKSRYDRQLQQRLAVASGALSQESEAERDAGPFDFAASVVPSTRRAALNAAKAKKQLWPIYASVAGLVVAAGAVTLVFLKQPDSSAEGTRATANHVAGVDPRPKPESKPAAEPKLTPPVKTGVKPDMPAAVAPPRAVPPKAATTGRESKLEMVGNPGDGNESALRPIVPAQVAMADPAAAAKSAKSKLTAVPEKPLQQAAEAKIREIFQQEFAAAKSSEAHAALAKKLVEQADGTKDDAAARYVLLRMAGEQAVLGGDAAQAIEVVDKMQEVYEIDAAGMRAEVLAAVVRQPTPEKTTNGAVFDIAMKLCDDAVARDDFELASRFAKSASAAARKSRDIDQNRLILARTKEIERLKGKFAGVQKALGTLEGDGSDGGANLVVGQWYCFTKGDWQKGLPMLAKSNRKDLADLAKRDLAMPNAARDRLGLGDAWWGLGEKETALGKSVFETRARHWYDLALPQLTGLDKAHVEKRLETSQIAGEPAGSPKSRTRGVVQKGNVALASNGATVTGDKIVHAECLLDGNSTEFTSTAGFAYGEWPLVWVVTLDKTYQLREIRFKTYDHDPRASRYIVSTSTDGKNFSVAADRSQTPVPCGWQRITFPPRPVKMIKLDGLWESKLQYFHVVELEAYCTPQPPPK